MTPRKQYESSDEWAAGLTAIIQRERSVAALSEAEARYRWLFEAARDGILTLDAQSGKISDVNLFLCELLGYSPAELLGKELWEIGGFEDVAANRAVFAKLQQTRCDWRKDLPLKRRDNAQVEVEFVTHIHQNTGENVIFCYIRNITDHIRMQREIDRQAGALSNAQRRKDEFLVMVFHELCNPLASILNSVGLLRLQEDHENPMQREARASIERQAAYLAGAVDDLLEISQVAAGSTALQSTKVELNCIRQPRGGETAE